MVREQRMGRWRLTKDVSQQEIPSRAYEPVALYSIVPGQPGVYKEGGTLLRDGL